MAFQIERIQKRFFRIIYPDLSYQDALALAECPSLEDNRKKLCFKLFNNLITQPGSKLSHLIPCSRYKSHGRLVRSGHKLTSYKCRTDRFNIFFSGYDGYLYQAIIKFLFYVSYLHVFNAI